MNNFTVKDKDNSITKIYLPGHLIKEIQHNKKITRGKYNIHSTLNGKYVVDNEKEKKRIE
jgi:hypothetical protein